MKSLWKWAAVSSATALLVACGGGGGGDGPISVANGDAQVAVNSTTGPNAVQAMATSITFPNGVPDFGTTGSTTLGVTATPLGSPPPSFTVTSGGSTASGDLTFGSCIFTVKSSTFAAGSKLATGAKITISNCTILLSTNGVPATGVGVSVNATLTLNTVTSNPYKVTVVITPTGLVQVNGLTVFTIKVSPLTGA